MVVGEEGAVTELWELVRSTFPGAHRRPARSARLRAGPAAAERGERPAPARLDDLDRLVVAAAAAYCEEVGVDAYARDPSLFEWRTRAQIEEDGAADGGRSHPLQGGGLGVDAGGRPAPAGLGRAGAARAGLRQARPRRPCRLLLETTPNVPFVRPENAPAIGLYDGIGMRRTITYRSLIFA